jgi:hypothetical protein
MVLVFLNLLLQRVDRDLLVFYDEVDLHLLDTEADRDKLVSTPDQTVHFDLQHALNQFVHVCLVIPRLDVQCDHRFGSGLGLAFLLLLVLCQSLLAFSDDFRIFLFVIGAKEINLIVIIGGRVLGVLGCSDCLWTVGGEWL